MWGREAWEGASYEGDLYKKYETGSTIRYKLSGHFQCQVYALGHNKLKGGATGQVEVKKGYNGHFHTGVMQ